MASETLILLGIQLGNKKDCEEMQRRCEGAAAWLRRHPDGRIVACGGRTGRSDTSEAAEMKRRLIALGISRERIILEDSSRITRENLTNALSMLANDEKGRLYLATSDYHMPRALLTLRRCGGSAKACCVRIPFSADKLRKMLIEPLYTIDLLMGHQDAGARRPAWTRAIMRFLHQDKP